MDKQTIELEVLNISNSQEQVGAFALLLGEINGSRQLPVIIGAAEAQSMLITLKGITPPRPLTHNLFASCLEILDVEMVRALIYRVENGVFYSYIYFKTDETIIRMDSRTSDAVSMALRMKAPIFIYEDILETEQVKTNIEEISSNESSSAKTNVFSDKNDLLDEDNLDTLQKALQKAINEEDYERAAKIRDKISKREKD